MPGQITNEEVEEVKKQRDQVFFCHHGAKFQILNTIYSYRRSGW